jgi:hypothetical protein
MNRKDAIVKGNNAFSKRNRYKKNGGYYIREENF